MDFGAENVGGIALIGTKDKSQPFSEASPDAEYVVWYLLYTPEIEVLLCTYSHVVYWKRTLLTTDTHRGSQVPAITQPEIYVLYIHSRSIFQEFPLE